MKVESKKNALKALDPKYLLLKTPEPPYVAVISTNIHNGKEQAAYDRAMDTMLALAVELPGFLGIEGAAQALDDGRTFKLSIVYWKDMDSLNAWRDHEAHVATKRKGKSLWYDEHNIRICEVKTHYGANLTH